MNNRLVTPLGEIQVFVDGVCSDYTYEKFTPNIRTLQEQPVTGSYRITITKSEWKTIRCIVSLCDTEIQDSEGSDERYSYREFIKDNIILTIGAGDDDPAFDTNQIRYGMEYINKAAMDQVMFGVAWTTDYEGPFDIRTQLATDLY